MKKAILFSLAFFFILCSAETGRAGFNITVTPTIKHFGNVYPNAPGVLPVLFVQLSDTSGTIPNDVTFVVHHYGLATVSPSTGSTSTPQFDTQTFTLGPNNPYILLDYSLDHWPNAPGYYVGHIVIEEQYNPFFSTVFTYDGTVVPPVGISDYVQLMQASGVGPTTFSPTAGSPIPAACTLAFCPINYSAKFFDYDNSGTTCGSWTWKIELYHSRGSYILPAASSSSMDLHIFSPFTLPANYDWFRDANGDIQTKVQVECKDSDGFWHHAEQLVGVKYPPNKTSGTITCSNGAPLMNKSVNVQWWDSTGMLGSQSTTTDGAGNFDVAFACSDTNRPHERFVVSCPGCGTWTIPTNHCWGRVGKLVCKQCGGCVSPPVGLSDWWTFDETAGNIAGDIAQYANQLSLSNSPAHTTGKVAGALCFDGQNDSAVAADHPEVNFAGDCTNDAAEPITIDAWVKTNAPGLQVIMDKRDQQGPNYLRGYSLFIDNGRLGFQMATGAGHLFCNAPNASCSNYLSPTSVHLNDGQWHFIAVTVSRCRGAVGRMYVDGNLVQTFTPRVGNISNHVPLLIGRRYPIPTTIYFKGCLDELEIFKRVLSKAELDTIYQADSYGKCKPSGPVIIKQ